MQVRNLLLLQYELISMPAIFCLTNSLDYAKVPECTNCNLNQGANHGQIAQVI